KKQLVIGFFIGTAFGFLLDRGGATDFNIITNQLLLKDFTVLKIIFTAIIIGMIGVHIIVRYSSPELQPKPCMWKSIIIGSLIFGVGFAVLGLCPGTASGAMGTGAIHAVFGVIGMLVGAGIFASVYPRLMKFMERDDMGPVTIPEISGIKARWIVLIISIILIVIMYLLDMVGY
ncbi:MAG: YeeE/YedE thiosulfate transporter family protein, partial [Candidatus Saliniplasma sp.]